MNTSTKNFTPILELKSDYEFVLEDLELAFPKDQLKQIIDQWNNGKALEDIATEHRRLPEEVFLALFDQARKRKVKRPFAWRGVS